MEKTAVNALFAFVAGFFSLGFFYVGYDAGKKGADAWYAKHPIVFVRGSEAEQYYEEQAECGKERWAVKTLADPDADVLMKGVPAKASMEALVNFPTYGEDALRAHENTRFGFEMTTVYVDAFVVGFKLETDDDIHIVLADPRDPTRTMVAEIPSGDCVPAKYSGRFSQLRANFVSDFGKTTREFRRLATPVRVTALGAVFMDYVHGQTGVAPNGVELHPLLGWTK